MRSPELSSQGGRHIIRTVECLTLCQNMCVADRRRFSFQFLAEVVLGSMNRGQSACADCFLLNHLGKAWCGPVVLGVRRKGHSVSNSTLDLGGWGQKCCGKTLRCCQVPGIRESADRVPTTEPSHSPKTTRIGQHARRDCPRNGVLSAGAAGHIRWACSHRRSNRAFATCHGLSWPALVQPWVIYGCTV